MEGDGGETDPSSGIVQGEGDGGELLIIDTDPSSGLVHGSTTVDPSPDTFSVMFTSDPTYIMIFITSLSIIFFLKPLKFLGRT